MKKKKKEDHIKAVIDHLYRVLLAQDQRPDRRSPHIVHWESACLPYDELQEAIHTIMSQTEFMVHDFDFYCKSMGGDSVGWQLTLHIKKLEPKP